MRNGWVQAWLRCLSGQVDRFSGIADGLGRELSLALQIAAVGHDCFFAGCDQVRVKGNNKELGTYLRDHYAAGVGAIELLEHQARTHKDKPLGAFFKSLLADVTLDLETLHGLLFTLGFEESRVRNAGAWMAEKLGRAKLGFSSETYGLPLLQALETLAIGITGKRLLWRALSEVRRADPAHQEIDFAALEKRAVDQFERVEAARLKIAIATFSE
jgi:hypothetical protein